MTKQQEIWESVARPKFPTLSPRELTDLKIQAALSWHMDEDTPEAQVYDQYYMMKKLMDVGWSD